MSSTAEDRIQLVLMRLQQCYRAMRPLLDDVDEREDFFAVLEVKGAFRELGDRLKEFARCQCGIGVRRGRHSPPVA